MLEKILVVYSEKITEKHKKAVEKVKRLVGERAICCICAEKLNEDYFKDIDLVITIGGDGAFSRASDYILDDTPILGINSEPEYSEGALTSLMEEEIEELNKILSGNFKIIKRERAGVIRNRVKIKQLCLDEVYVGAENQFHTSRYIIKFKGKSEEQRSSGVIIVTGTGSNSWYKSIGRKPFSYDEKKLKFTVREPYIGNRLFQSKILEGEINPGEKIEFESKRYAGGVVAIDANIIYPFNTGDIVEIFLSDKPLSVVVKCE